jgi:hypothetical protein
MSIETPARLRPAMMSFDVFGTLISVRDSSYGAFERILADAGARHLDVQAFWEYWEHRNIALIGTLTGPIAISANSPWPKPSPISVSRAIAG